MININTVTAAVKTLLDGNGTVAAWLNKPVVNGDFINELPGQTPWVGVYRGGVKHNPRTLGMQPNNWESTITLKIVLQDTSYVSAADCESLLELHTKDIITALVTDTTIGNTVDMINNFDISYGYIDTDRESLYYQTAIITFEAEVRA